MNQKQPIDGAQLRALLRTFRKTEWRGSLNPLTGQRSGKIWSMLVALGFNLLFSMFLGVIIFKSQQIHSAIAIAALGAMVFIAFQVMLEFGHTIITSEDYDVISPLPVNSRTFFAAKIIHFLSHVSLLTLALGFAPTLVAWFKSGSALITVETFIVLWLSALTASLLIAYLYTLALRVSGERMMERTLGYVQMALSMSIILGYLAFPGLIQSITTMDTDTIAFFKFSPTMWFVNAFRLLSEGWDVERAAFGLLGIIFLTALYWLGSHRLGLSYARTLAETRLAQSKRATVKDTPWAKLWRKKAGHEQQAVMALILAQFRGDIRFRMTILPFAPMLAVYAIWGAFHGWVLPDPFEAIRATGESDIIIYMVSALLPLILATAIQYSPSYRAAWVFFATPLDRQRLLVATRDVTTVICVIPLFIALTGILTYYFGNPFHALLHAVFVAVLIRLVLLTQTFLTPAVPFAKEQTKGMSFSLRYLLTLFLPSLVIIPLMIISSVGYGGYWLYAALVGLVLTMDWGFRQLTDKHLLRRVESWELLT